MEDVFSVAFSPDGHTLASGYRIKAKKVYGPAANEGNALKLWDVASGRALRSFWIHSLTVTSVAFSPDGRSLASNCETHCKALTIWDVASGRVLRTLKLVESWPRRKFIWRLA